MLARAGPVVEAATAEVKNLSRLRFARGGPARTTLRGGAFEPSSPAHTLGSRCWPGPGQRSKQPQPRSKTSLGFASPGVARPGPPSAATLLHRLRELTRSASDAGPGRASSRSRRSRGQKLSWLRFARGGPARTTLRDGAFAPTSPAHTLGFRCWPGPGQHLKQPQPRSKTSLGCASPGVVRPGPPPCDGAFAPSSPAHSLGSRCWPGPGQRSKQPQPRSKTSFGFASPGVVRPGPPSATCFCTVFASSLAWLQMLARAGPAAEAAAAKVKNILRLKSACYFPREDRLHSAGRHSEALIPAPRVEYGGASDAGQSGS